MQLADRQTSADLNRHDEQWLSAHWMPFTGNRNFKARPRIITGAQGAYYSDADGRRIFDGLSGLWCRAGPWPPRDRRGHWPSRAAARLLSRLPVRPPGLVRAGQPHRGADAPGNVFFTGSGSEAADTSLKMARAYWRAKGQGSKTRLIGREKGYHGVNFGGISVGGMGGNRKMFGQGSKPTICRTPSRHRFVLQGPAQTDGRALADRLLDLIALHDASNIAAVIVEPMSGSGGVVIPPAGYLQRLREICTQHDILLIFDEVITGFGRLGAMTAAEAFGVTPDIMNIAKQVSNGAQPLGACVVTPAIYEQFMAAAASVHAGICPRLYLFGPSRGLRGSIAALDLLEREDGPPRARAGPLLRAGRAQPQGRQACAGHPQYRPGGRHHDCTLPGEPARRPYEIAMKCWEAGFYVRYGGDTIQLAPPFISEQAEIERLINALGDALQATD
jgi:beta-alanine--pyruvate transaminase